MKYYLHDTNAFHDEKISELFIQFGYEGLGLFYTILERIAAQEKPIKTAVLKKQLRVGKKLDKCWQFMEQIGVISSNNGETFNERILSYSETYKIKKEKNAERILQWRKNQDNKKNVTGSESVSNTPKVKVSKVKRSKDMHTHIEAHEQKDIDSWNKFQSWVNENTPRLNQMKKPLTIDQYLKLKNTVETKILMKVLAAMENFAPLLTKYTSTNLTIQSWVEREKSSPQIVGLQKYEQPTSTPLKKLNPAS